MFEIAEISLSNRVTPVAAPVKFCLRHSYRIQVTTGMLLVRYELAAKLGLESKIAIPIQVKFGYDEDFGKMRFRRAERGEVSNSLARPGNGRHHIFFIPLGSQKIFVSAKLPATVCEYQVIENGSHKWLEVMLPREALKGVEPKPLLHIEPVSLKETPSQKPSRKEIINAIGKMSA